jgi:hypothetical protein
MKGMKRTTLIMVALGAVIGVVVWLEFRRGETDAGKQKEPVEIFPFLGEEVTRVELVRGKATIAVEKQELGWRMTSPRDWPVGMIPMMVMLREIAPSEKAYPLPEGKAPDAAVHGLDSPAVVVTLSCADGRRSAIALGNPLGAGDRIYLRRVGNPEVLSASRALLGMFDVEPEKLRDTGFCRFQSKSVESITQVWGGKELRVARQGRGWRLTGAVDDLADPAAIDEWAVRLSGIESPTLLPRPKPSRAEFGLDPPFASFEIVLKGKTIKVAVGALKAEGEKRRWADTSEYPDDIGTIDEKDLAVVTPLADSLRARRALPWPMAEVTTLAGSGAAEFEVRKDGTGWSCVKPAILPGFIPERVTSLLIQLASAPMDGRMPVAPPPAGALHLTFKFGQEAGAVEHSADLWSDGPDTFMRTTDPERVIRVLGPSWWVHASAGALYFKDPLLPTGIIMHMQVKRISVTDRNNLPWVDAEFNGKEWRLVSAAAGSKILDSEKMARFNQFWSTMQVETWVSAKKDSPEVGLSGAPVWRIRIVPDPDRASNAVERVILVGKDGPGDSMYAILEGDDTVFLVDPRAAGLLRGGVWKE